MASDPSDGPRDASGGAAHPDARVAGWRAPDAAGGPRDDRAVVGALGGSRLFEQPQYRAEAERFAAFIAPPGPVAVEVGFDHGRRLRALAEADPGTRWVGLEVRRARVRALAAHAPPNLLPWRADARTVFARLVPPGRLARVDVLFPTPWWHAGHRAKRLLLTDAFLADVARGLADDGILHVATDVEPYFEHVARQVAAWHPVSHPPPAPVPSRREHSCHRDGIPIRRGTWRPPRPAEAREPLDNRSGS